jgi:rare lipoprotein A
MKKHLQLALNNFLILSLILINFFTFNIQASSIRQPRKIEPSKTNQQVPTEQASSKTQESQKDSDEYIETAELLENENLKPDYQVEIIEDNNDLYEWISNIIELDQPNKYSTDEDIEIYEYLQSLMAEYHLYLSGVKAYKRSCAALGANKTANGRASWYGGKFHGRKTANGERFNKNSLTAAHKTIPFNSIVEVTYRGKSVLVRINDAGPYHGNRIIDLSEKAARDLGMIGAGTGNVTLKIIKCGKKNKA